MNKALTKLISEIPPDVLMSEYRQRVKEAPPKVRQKLSACPFCDKELTARERRKHKCPERPPKHTLSEKQAQNVQRVYKRGLADPKYRVSQQELADRYGITVQAISQIVRGETHRAIKLRRGPGEKR